MNSDERQLVRRPSGGELVVPTDLVARTLSHARLLAARPVTTALARAGDIFDAIDRFDAAAVGWIVRASPSVVSEVNENDDNPLGHAIRTFLANDSYWRWISHETAPPVSRLGDDPANLLRWRESLWGVFVKQELALCDIVRDLCQGGAVYHIDNHRWETDCDIRTYLIASLLIEKYSRDIERLSSTKVLPILVHNWYYLRGRRHEILGNWAMAIADYESAIGIMSDVRHTRRHLLDFFYLCPDVRYRDRSRALQMARDGGTTDDLMFMAIVASRHESVPAALAYIAQGQRKLAEEIERIRAKISEPRKYQLYDGNDAATLWQRSRENSQYDRYEEMIAEYQQEMDDLTQLREKIVHRSIGDEVVWEERPADWPWRFPDGESREIWIQKRQWVLSPYMEI